MARNQAETSTASFFDDFKTPFKFVGINDSHKKDLSSPPTLLNSILCRNIPSKTEKQGNFALYNHILALYDVKKLMLLTKYS